MFWNVYARSYDNLARHFRPYQDLVQEVCDHVDEYAQGRSLRVLDAGCGTGNYSIELARRGHTVVGVDNSESMLARARKKSSGMNSVTFIEHDLTQPLPFDDGEFDAVVSVHVLYALHDAGGMVVELGRIASHDALLLLVNPHKPARPLDSVRELASKHGWPKALRASVSLLGVAVWNTLINRRRSRGDYLFTDVNSLSSIVSYAGFRVVGSHSTYTLQGSALVLGRASNA